MLLILPGNYHVCILLMQHFDKARAEQCSNYVTASGFKSQRHLQLRRTWTVMWTSVELG